MSYTSVAQLLKSKERWCQGASARSKESFLVKATQGEDWMHDTVNPNDERASKWSIEGALHKIYPDESERVEKRARVEMAIDTWAERKPPKKSKINLWNDNLAVDHAEVALILRFAGV